MIKISELTSGQVVIATKGLMWCYEHPSCDGTAFSIKVGTHLIYDGFIVSDNWGIFLKFIHIENCKIVYSMWTRRRSVNCLNDNNNAFEII